MANQGIGLTATLDITNFQRNAAAYMRTLNQAQSATSSTASSINNSFAGVGNTLIPALNNIGKGFLAVGAAATAAAVGGIALFGSASMQMATDFEQSLADIAAKLRTTLDGVKPLRDEIFNLSINPNLKVSLTEAANASQVLASSGIDMATQLNGALQKTVEFQNAVGGDFSNAANVAITALDVFNMGTDRLGEAIDGATGAINRSKLNVQSYKYAITNAGSAYTNFGITLRQFNTIVATTASSFSTGMRQGTAMAEMINRMVAPTERAQKVMAKLGLTFFDEQGRAKDLYKIVDELNNAMKGLTQQARGEALIDIFGSAGGRAVQALLDKTAAGLKAYENEVNAAGQAATAAATRTNTLQSSLQTLNDIIIAFGTSLGGMLTPALTDMVQAVNANLNMLIAGFDKFGLSGVANMLKLSDQSRAMATNIDTSFKTISDTLSKQGLLAVINEMGISTQELAIAFYAATGAAKGLLILGTIGATIFTLSVAMAALTNPIFLLISGAALLGAAWNTNFYGMQAITAKFSEVLGHAVNGWKTIINDGIEAWQGIFARLTDGFEAWKAMMSRLPGFMSTIMKSVSSAFSGYIGLWPKWMTDVMKSIYDTIVNTMSAALSYFGSAVSGLSSMLPSMPAMDFSIQAPAFPDLSQSFEEGLGMFALPPTLGLQIATPEVYKFAEATAMATQRAKDANIAYGEMNTNLSDVSSGAKSVGKSVSNMAEDIVKAREKISDQNISMANLRGEIAALESQYPGLTQEVVDNFNAHIAAGGSVASFGDKLGATERRQMFNYLVKLIDINQQNKQLMSSNGLVDKSLTGVGDSFMAMVDTMSKGLDMPMLDQFPVVGQLMPPETSQGMADTSTAMTSASSAATTLNPLLTTMAGTFTDALNPALLAASTYMPIISKAWADISVAVTTLTTEPLPLLVSLFNDSLLPAVTKLSEQAGILANTSLYGLSNVINAQLLPSLGQLFTSFSTQLLPATIPLVTQSNLLVSAYIALKTAGDDVVEVSKRIYDALIKEAAKVKDLTTYYLALAKAKREANAAGASTQPQPAEPGAGFASGGSFIVPSGYPASGAGMPIRVHSGELVKVFTAAQTRQMNRSQANQRIVSNSTNTTNNSSKVVNFNITTQQPSKSILSDLAFAKAKYGVF